jgi:hypothetical protein
MIQILSTNFVREGVTRIEGFSQFILPKVFTQAVLMLSSLKSPDLKNYQYQLVDIHNFDDLINFIKSLLDDEEYWIAFEENYFQKKHLFETFHDRNFVDIKKSVQSALSAICKSSGIHELLNVIFHGMHILGCDLGHDSNTLNGEEFLKLYLSDNPKERSLGLRKIV